MRKNRNGLGRPALPEEQRKSPLNCHLPNWVIDRLGEIAERRRLSRNKLAAEVLHEFVVRDARVAGDGVIVRNTGGDGKGGA